MKTSRTSKYECVEAITNAICVKLSAVLHDHMGALTMYIYRLDRLIYFIFILY